MKSLSRGTAFAVPTVLAMTFGGLLLAAPAHAADAFAVTTPAPGATGVAQTFPNVVPFEGTGAPAGDNVTVSYLDADGASHNATFGGSTVDAATGQWSGNENFDQLSPGQTAVVATVTAVNAGGTVDLTTTTSFELAVAPNSLTPFTVTKPVSNSTTPVESTTPTFEGAGQAGDTITITYGARAAKTGVAATTVVKADNTWSTTTDFSQLEPGATEGSALVNETDPAGNPVPGADQKRINFVFPSAPAAAVPASIAVTPTKTSVLEASTTGVAVSAKGFSPDEQVVVAVTDAKGTVIPLAGDRPAQTFASDTDGSYTDVLRLPANLVGGTYTVTIVGVRSGVSVKSSFYALGAPTITSPTNGQKLVGSTVTFAGTGTPGSDIGVIVLTTKAYKAALAQAKAAEAKSSASASRLASPRAGTTATPADPTARIIVGANGRWSVTLAAKPGDYTAVAIAALLDANGDPVVDAAGTPVAAGPSAPVEFTLTAAVVTPAAAGTGVDGNGTTTLAYTGSDTAPLAIGGSLVLLAGAGLLLAARRRRSLEV
ncbi:LPXTG cell wall anchor domain-containing protein [Frondihabitans sp. VKM Ac-2883]|uniref:LPXTG cell wall anchor domain-containing protein n=1 Tax=Frondihabitans sp. VKM Ac-2883 TaxID=2783823 RepID=UPI00188DAA86|nr:LPXTG cell wall anchor domain-containing protein [Frondihabitans sp. VKM Ac-2883]MBF4575598.1 LPXTG cell wall anchor domain-containing protein [Frondihabitans sp. VKM Ac-2883]